MNNSLIGQAMLLTYAEMGIQIDKMEDTDDGIILLFTVPKSSWEYGHEGKEMAGKHLASRVKHTLEEMGMVFSDIRYHIRDEHWDKAKSDAAKKQVYTDLGYKKWQMSK